LLRRDATTKKVITSQTLTSVAQVSGTECYLVMHELCHSDVACITIPQSAEKTHASVNLTHCAAFIQGNTKAVITKNRITSKFYLD